MQCLLPAVNDAILANLRNLIRDREVELGRHGCHNAGSHRKYLHVALLSETEDEETLCGYLRHLQEVER